MSAVWMRLRAEMRSRWRAWVGIGLLVAVAGGAVTAAAAGARRTDSAYTRFLAASHAWDAILFDDNSAQLPPIPIDKVKGLPQVETAIRGFYTYAPFGEGLGSMAAEDERYGTTIDRFKILRGRAADPKSADEVTVGFVAAQRFHIRLGQTFSLIPRDFEEEAQRRGIPNPTFRVVGIEASPGEFPPYETGGLYLHMTPAFFREAAKQSDAHFSLIVRLKQRSDLAAFRRAVEPLFPQGFVPLRTQGEASAAVQRSLHLQAVVLWLLAGLTALVALLVLAQVLARLSLLEATDYPTLHALGATPRQLWGLGILRAAVAGLIGAAGAAAIALALSPLMPFGLARTAEPSPGFRVDALVIGAGAAVTMAIVALLAMWPSWRAARAAASAEGLGHLGPERPSGLGERLARAGLPSSVVIGARLALEPGRGRAAVPVRSTLAGAFVGVAAVAASLSFGASFTHLVRTPPLYGWRWDAALTTFGEADLSPYLDRVRSSPVVEAMSFGNDLPFTIRGVRTLGLAFDGVGDSVVPPVGAGRQPLRANEIALGSKVLRRINAHVGDTVDVSIPGDAKARRMHIVGRVVMPSFFDAHPGEGALTVGISKAFPDLPNEFRTEGDLFLRFRPGVDRARGVAAVRSAIGNDKVRISSGDEVAITEVLTELPRETPADLANFGRVQNFPVILGGLIALLAAATLAHTVASAVRRRARDLAILKTIGFDRGGVRAAVAWQATTLTIVALLAGLPIGIAAGRWAWHLFADQLGVIAQARVPSAAVLIMIPAALVLANAIGALPARAAARVHPALVLRTE